MVVGGITNEISNVIHPEAKTGTMDYLFGRDKAKAVVKAQYNNARSSSSRAKYWNRLEKIKLQKTLGTIKYGIIETGKTIIDEIKNEIYRDEVNEDILNQYAYHIEAKKGALDYIKKCASENKKMAVLTSNTRALSEKVLDRLGMLEYMENVYSADELKMSKREVDIYEYVLKDLNTTAESAIVFEDSMYAINTARSLNIECIGLVNPNNQKVFEKNHVKTIVDFTELC